MFAIRMKAGGGRRACTAWMDGWIRPSPGPDHHTFCGPDGELGLERGDGMLSALHQNLDAVDAGLLHRHSFEELVMDAVCVGGGWRTRIFSCYFWTDDVSDHHHIIIGT
jgi:hypothetical protein